MDALAEDLAETIETRLPAPAIRCREDDGDNAALQPRGEWLRPYRILQRGNAAGAMLCPLAAVAEDTAVAIAVDFVGCDQRSQGLGRGWPYAPRSNGGNPRLRNAFLLP